MVLAIAGAHFVIDLNHLLRSTPFPASTTAGFLLIPVGYAAVSFGSRGSVTTAVWMTVVWLPDLLLPQGPAPAVGGSDPVGAGDRDGRVRRESHRG